MPDMRITRHKAKKLSTIFVIFGLLFFITSFFGFVPRAYGFPAGLACLILYALIEIAVLIFSKRKPKE